MHEALNLKVLQQTSVGVFKTMAAEPPKSSPRHAHRKGYGLQVSADGS